VPCRARHADRPKALEAARRGSDANGRPKHTTALRPGKASDRVHGEFSWVHGITLDQENQKIYKFFKI
jgi:hypothetical protein